MALARFYPFNGPVRRIRISVSTLVNKRFLYLGILLTIIIIVLINSRTKILSSFFSIFPNSHSQQVVNLALNSNIETLDPANAYDLVTGNVVYQIYEPLFEYHYLKRPYTLRPLLAAAMPIVKDGGKTYIIKIKKNIYYHPNPCFKGEKRYLKSQDFVNQIKRLAFAPLKSNGWWSVDGVIKGVNEFRDKVGNDFNKFYTIPISGLKTPDDYTLVIELNEPNLNLSFLLAMAHTSPIPIEAIKYYKNDLSKYEVGTGPFVLKEWTPDKMIKLQKFSDYIYRDEFYPSTGSRMANDKNLLSDAGKRIPFIDEIDFYIIKDFRTRWQAFISKQIDLIDNIPNNDIKNVISSPGEPSEELKKMKVKSALSPSLIVWWLAFNMRDEVVGKNHNLRLAIAHAIDIDKYIKLFTNNIGQRANSIYIPGVPGYDPRRQLDFDYNPVLSQKYLKLAGYSAKNPPPTIIFDTRGDDTNNRVSAEFLQSELAKIGINLQIRYNTFIKYLEREREGKLQFWQGGWALDFPDSVNILQLLLTKSFPPGPNVSYYSNKDFDQLFKEVKVMENGAIKLRLLKKMEDLVLADLPWIPTHYERKHILYHNWLKNYYHTDLIYNYLKYVRVSR